MSRGLLALLFAVSIAGCVQPAQVESAAVLPTPVPVDAFHPAIAAGGAELVAPAPLKDVLLGQPGYAEPNIAVAPDGTIYISNPGRPPTVWRSDDKGQTFKKTEGKGIEGGGDADIAVGPDGTLYFLGLFGADKRAIPFLASTDKGESWSKAIDVSAGSGADREWIDTTPAGDIYTTWRGATGLEFNASYDGGQTWLPKVVTLAPDGIQGPLAHDPVTGALAVPAADFAEPAGLTKSILHVHVSANKGATWESRDAWTLPRSSPVEANGYVTDFPAVAFDGAGTLYLTYSADMEGMSGGTAPPEAVGLYGIYLQVSHDLGATWTDPALLSTPGMDARFPWIAAGAPGRVAIVWYENENGIPGEMLPDTWNAWLYESITADQESIVSEKTKLTAQPIHTGALCTSGTGCVGPADRSMLDFFEVALGLDGQPVVAFASSDLSVSVPLVGRPAVKPTEVRFVTVEGTSLL